MGIETDILNQIKLIAGSTASTATNTAANVAAATDAADALTALGDPRAFAVNPTVVGAGLLVVSNTAYWVYQGYFARATVINHVRVALITPAVGTQATEIALASSPLAPNRAAQVLTKIASDDTLGDLTGAAGLYTNTAGMAASVAAGTHLWAGFRAAFTSTPTQPTLLALANDFGQGRILSTAAAGALSGAGPWTGATIAHALTAQCPLIIATKD